MKLELKFFLNNAFIFIDGPVFSDSFSAFAFIYIFFLNSQFKLILSLNLFY